MINGANHDGIATDPISGIQTRRSMQARRSLDPHRMSMGSNGFGRGGDREGLIHAYDEEENNAGFGLTDLTEDSDDDAPPPSAKIPNGLANGNGNKKSFSEPIESERPKKSLTR